MTTSNKTLFSVAKAQLRRLQKEQIIGHLGAGNLTYFGLPSSYIEDILEWRQLLKRVVAVEWGKKAPQGLLSHYLTMRLQELFTYSDYVVLKGNIDHILRDQKDGFGNLLPEWSFDIINLDYDRGAAGSWNSFMNNRKLVLEKLFLSQRKKGIQKFLLFYSARAQHQLDEIRNALKQNYNYNLSITAKASEAVGLYSWLMISNSGSSRSYDTQPILNVGYAGNHDVEMSSIGVFCVSCPDSGIGMEVNNTETFLQKHRWLQGNLSEG